MAVLLFIIGSIILLFLYNWISAHKDRVKEEEHQREITNQVRSAMDKKQYFNKREFHDGWAVVSLPYSRYTFVDEHGNYLSDEIFVYAEDFQQGTAIVKGYNKGVGIINTKGEFVLPYNTNPKVGTRIERIYYGIYAYYKTYYKKPNYVLREELYIIKQNGEFLTKRPISKIIEIKNNYIKYQFRGLIGEMDFTGRPLSISYRKKISLGNGLYRVQVSSFEWGIYDKNVDEIIIPCEYSGILYLEDKELFILEPYRDGEHSFPACVLNREKQIITPIKYGNISVLDNKYIQVGVPNKQRGMGLLCGIVDFSGKELVKPLYDSVWASENGKFMVVGAKRCGHVKDNGESDLEYSSYTSVCMAGFRTSNKYMDELEDIPYHESFSATPKFLIVSKNDKYGVVDLDNNCLLPFVYDSIKSVDGEKNIPVGYIVQQDKKYGFVNLNGIVIIPISYATINARRDCDYSNYVPIYDTLHYNYSIEKEMKELENFQNFLYGKPLFFEVQDENGKVLLFDSSGNIYTKKNKESVLTKSPSLFNNETKPQPIPRKKKRLLFFDTETTGLPKDYNAPASNTSNWPRLVQLSWSVAEEDGFLISEHNFIIRPDGFTIPNESSKVHGITTNKAIKEGSDLNEVIELFINAVETSDMLIGHNIDFDIKVVEAELYRLHKADCLKGKKRICTMKSTVNFCEIPGTYGFKYPQLQELYFKLFGKHFEGAHNSATDNKATMECYFELRNNNIL